MDFYGLCNTIGLHGLQFPSRLWSELERVSLSKISSGVFWVVSGTNSCDCHLECIFCDRLRAPIREVRDDPYRRLVARVARRIEHDADLGLCNRQAARRRQLLFRQSRAEIPITLISGGMSIRGAIVERVLPS